MFPGRVDWACVLFSAWLSFTHCLNFLLTKSFSFIRQCNCVLTNKYFFFFYLYSWIVWQDYPSIAHLVQKLSDNNIQTIFAVTEEFQPVYKVNFCL